MELRKLYPLPNSVKVTESRLEVGGSYSTYGEDEKRVKNSFQNLQGTGHFGDIRVDSGKMLKWN
jgi:hypothetical protein